MPQDFSQNLQETSNSTKQIVTSLRLDIMQGSEWTGAIVKAMAAWKTPEENHLGSLYIYLIAGEAFDWILLAQRLCFEIRDLISEDEIEQTLFLMNFPGLQAKNFQKNLGPSKFRGYLNFYYGVFVEQALQLATELEIQKHYTGNGILYKDDYANESFSKIYGLSQDSLLEKYRTENKIHMKDSITMSEYNAFTYWLFKYRLKSSDQSKIASDTDKGLKQLQPMWPKQNLPHKNMDSGYPLQKEIK